jgi:hypothetical protein
MITEISAVRARARGCFATISQGELGGFRQSDLLASRRKDDWLRHTSVSALHRHDSIVRLMRWSNITNVAGDPLWDAIDFQPKELRSRLALHGHSAEPLLNPRLRYSFQPQLRTESRSRCGPQHATIGSSAPCWTRICPLSPPQQTNVVAMQDLTGGLCVAPDRASAGTVRGMALERRRKLWLTLWKRIRLQR